MDVSRFVWHAYRLAYRSASLLACVLALAACAAKTSTTVFPQSNPKKQDTCPAARIENKFIVQWEDGRVTLHEDENADRFIARFVEPHLQQIKHVEFDRVIRVSQAFGTTETATDHWGQDMSEAAAVWSQGIEGEGVRVGVVDQGMDYTHPQIQPRLAVNDAEFNGKPGVDDDANGFVDDIYGWDFYSNGPTPVLGTDVESSSHGTHVAGIIAADHSTGPIQGMAPKAQLVASAFLSAGGQDP
ncbi:MAG: hypothetical protein C5B49_03170, partial [Bdellovibrio sp.]